MMSSRNRSSVKLRSIGRNQLVKLWILLGVFGDIGNLLNPEPLQKYPEFSLSPRNRRHYLVQIVNNLSRELICCAASRWSGLERIQHQEKPAGDNSDVITVGVALSNLAIKESRRFEDQEHNPLDGQFRIFCAELAIDEERFLRRVSVRRNARLETDDRTAGSFTSRSGASCDASQLFGEMELHMAATSTAASA